MTVAVCLYHHWRRAYSTSKGLHQVPFFGEQECPSKESHVQVGEVLQKDDGEEGGRSILAGEGDHQYNNLVGQP